MKLLYRVLIRVLRVFSHLYFREVRSSGSQQVPENGPVMLAANHPSSILDSILLATQIRRPINYLARSGLFRFPVLAALYRHLGAIPVYRAHETEGHAGRNEAVFEKVYELFEKGGCVGIFPEGRNSPQAQIAELRTGAARMALEAEARNGFRLGLIIVPVGINFEHSALLMSDVLLRFGMPLRVADYGDIYRNNEAEAVRRLTDDVQAALRRQALHIEDRHIGKLAGELSEVFGDDLNARLQIEAEEANQKAKSPSFVKRWLWKLLVWYHRSSQAAGEAFEIRVYSRQHVNEILARTAAREPEELTALANQVERYKDHLRQTELRQTTSLHQPFRERLIRLRMTIYALVMAPVALFGWVHNAIPYLLTRWAALFSKDEAVRTFAYFAVGFIAFTATYTALGVWLWHYTPLTPGWTLAYLAALPPTGFAALRYRRNLLIYRDKILVRTFIWNNEELVELLRHERELIFERFKALEKQFGQ